MSIFINYTLYVGYSLFSQYGTSVLQTPPYTPNVPVRATSCSAQVPHNVTR
jgi:hypothetical protein